jgi:hypothetical protein
MVKKQIKYRKMNARQATNVLLPMSEKRENDKKRKNKDVKFAVSQRRGMSKGGKKHVVVSSSVSWFLL